MRNQIKIVLFVFFVLCPSWGITQQFYKATGVVTDFYSSAPVEDIHAVSNEGISVLNVETGEIIFKIKIRSFQFAKSKMQEHFNENFMESHKYPVAEFKGRFNDEINLSQSGEYPITLIGILDIHGKRKKRKIPALIDIDNGKMLLRSRFEVACEDHEIKIPKILWKNIAEVVEVKVKANYTKM